MAKDYGRRNSSRHRGSVSKQLLLVLVCFLSGYLSASIFDFTSLSGWVNTQLLAQHTPSIAVKPAPQQAQLPKPKFEFYTLLANERAGTSERAPTPGATDVITAAAPPSTSTAPTTTSTSPTIPTEPAGPMNLTMTKNPPVPPELPPAVSAKSTSASSAVISKDAYLVQIASFRSKQEAERMKASLSLKGFEVSVATITQQRTIWYRVVIGPFSSRPQAVLAQAAVARSEHIMGMIRKMDV